MEPDFAMRQRQDLMVEGRDREKERVRERERARDAERERERERVLVNSVGCLPRVRVLRPRDTEHVRRRKALLW